MKIPDLFIDDCDLKKADQQKVGAEIDIIRMEVIPKIRTKAAELSTRILEKSKTLSTHELDEEIKELQSILDELQHFGIVVSFDVHHSTKKPCPSSNGATVNPGSISVTDDSVSDGDSDNTI